MARTLEFDYTAALERATLLFWETGYLGTSQRDLLDTMGIGGGSFHNTFKSKKNVYLECLSTTTRLPLALAARRFFQRPRPQKACTRFSKRCLTVWTTQTRPRRFA